MGDDTHAASLADKIKNLSPAAQLRLAADLIEAGRHELAHSLVSLVGTQLGAALLLTRGLR